LEGHLDLDHELLNAEGGIVRPHILTVAKNSGKVLGIRKNWDEADAKEEKKMHFVHYRFLPGLGFYGFGLIHMIGGLTTSVTSILRQLIDSGTFANLPGGLKAKGMRVDGEDTPIGPGEWRDVDVAGGTIRDSLMPLPYKEPSMVLSQLLGVLVQTGQRFASIADMQVGDTSGQQQPVGTTVAMLERGTKVMSAIHKRLHNSQKQEFKIMARVMHENMEEGEQYPYAVQGKDQHVMTADFDGKVDVLPVSDPNIFSMAQRVMLASQQLQMAQAAPQVHDVREAYRRMYAAMGVSDIETILKPEQKPKRVTPMMEHRKLLQNQKLEPVQDMNHQAHLEMHLMMMNHPVVSNNIEFTTNLVQDMMGHIGFLARQQAKAQQPPQQTPQMPGQPPQQQMMPQQPPADITAIELELFKKYLPEMMPPEQEDPLAELQRRQLDITEQYNNGKLGVDEFKAKIAATVDMAKIAADERMAEAINNIKIEDTILNAKLDLRKEAVAGNAPATGNTNNQR